MENEVRSNMKTILRYFGMFIFLNCSPVIAETIPSLQIVNYKNDLAYIITAGPEVVIGSDYEDACKMLGSYGYVWKTLPSKSIDPACYSPTNMDLRGADTWYCADTTVAYYNVPWWMCSSSFKGCPSAAWKLSANGLNCTRPNPKCSATAETVSEITLIAAIVYGEAAVNGPYEEKAALANAIVRKSKSYGYASVKDYIRRRRKQISSANGKNIRFNTVMCSNVKIEYPQLYEAAINALDEKGVDYANGGCYWDGKDLKVSKKKHLHYPWGYLISDPSHDVLNVGSTPPFGETTDYGKYEYTLESTAGYGHTIFWKLTSDFMNAKRVKQCH
jgi:hypothetical protein